MRREKHEALIVMKSLIEEMKHMTCVDNMSIPQYTRLLDNMLYNLEIYLYSDDNDFEQLKTILSRDWEKYIHSVFEE